MTTTTITYIENFEDLEKRLGEDGYVYYNDFFKISGRHTYYRNIMEGEGAVNGSVETTALATEGFGSGGNDEYVGGTFETRNNTENEWSLRYELTEDAKNHMTFDFERAYTRGTDGVDGTMTVWESNQNGTTQGQTFNTYSNLSAKSSNVDIGGATLALFEFESDIGADDGYVWIDDIQAKITADETLVVTKLGDKSNPDDGLLTLREAVEMANALDGYNKIVFDRDVFSGGDKTIDLTSTITIADDLDIDASSVGGVTISGDVNGDDDPFINEVLAGNFANMDDNSFKDDNVRLFEVRGNGTDAGFDTLTFTGGYVEDDDGGAVKAYSGTSVAIADSTFTGNGAYSDSHSGVLSGGAVDVSGGSIVVENSTFNANSVVSQGTTVGGAISAVSSDAVYSNVTLHGNYAHGDIAVGAGAYSDSSTVEVINTTITGSVANGVQTGGVGMYSIDGDVTVKNSILVGNTELTRNDQTNVVYVDVDDYASARTVADNIENSLFGVYGASGSAYTDGSEVTTGVTVQDVFADNGWVGKPYSVGTAFATLDDNGGPVQTVALKDDISNPALDIAAFDGTAPLGDARGMGRDSRGSTTDTPIDAGAYELQRNDAIGEFGTIDLDMNWVKVDLAHNYADAAVVAFVQTNNGGHMVDVRIKDVDQDSFWIRLDEPEMYTDNYHAIESVQWMVMESGRHVLDDGTVVEAGVLSTDAVHQSTYRGAREDVSFQDDMTDAFVFTSVNSNQGSDWVTERVGSVTSEGFTVAMQEQEDKTDGHLVEDIGWIAFDTANTGALNPDVFVWTDTVDHTWSAASTLDYGIAEMQTYNGSDTAVVRSDGGQRHYLQEDTSYNAETTHVDETVAFLDLGSDSGFFYV